MTKEQFQALNVADQVVEIDRRRQELGVKIVQQELGLTPDEAHNLIMCAQCSDETKAKLRSGEFTVKQAIYTLMDEETRKYHDTLDAINDDNPNANKFRKVWAELEELAKVDSFGGMECIRKWDEWCKAGQPLKNLKIRLAG